MNDGSALMSTSAVFLPYNVSDAATKTAQAEYPLRGPRFPAFWGTQEKPAARFETCGRTIYLYFRTFCLVTCYIPTIFYLQVPESITHIRRRRGNSHDTPGVFSFDGCRVALRVVNVMVRLQEVPASIVLKHSVRSTGGVAEGVAFSA